MRSTAVWRPTTSRYSCARTMPRSASGRSSREESTPEVGRDLRRPVKTMVRAVNFEAKSLSGEVEGGYLPAPVGKQAVDAHRAEFHLIVAAHLFALCIDFRTGGEKRQALSRVASGASGRIAGFAGMISNGSPDWAKMSIAVSLQDW